MTSKGNHGATSSASPKAAVVLLNFNSLEDTTRCIESLLGQTNKPQEIICVDNASTDGSPDEIAGRFRTVRLMRSPKNIGFGGGMNIGFREAMKLGAEYILCFNNDALIPDPHTVDKLVTPFLQDPKVGITGPEEMDYEGREVLYTGPRGRHRFEMKVSGAAFMVSGKALSEVGLFDEGFFLGYEDQDLMLRVEKAGYRVVMVHDAKFRHRRMATIGKHSAMMTYIEARNEIVFYARQYGVSGFLERVVRKGMRRHPRMTLMFAEEKRWDLLKAYYKGMASGLRYLPEAKRVNAMAPFDPEKWMRGK